MPNAWNDPWSFDTHWTRRGPVILAIVCLALLFGCDDDPTEPSPDRDLNPVAPTANALIAQHHVGGDPDGQSSIYKILEVGDGTWFAQGTDEGFVSVMRLASDGTPLWVNHVGSYLVRGVATVTAPWLPLGLISVGTSDSNDDGQVDNSRVSAWGADDTLLDEILLTSGDLSRFASDVAVLSSSADKVLLLIVGSAWQAEGPFYPWATIVSLNSDSTLAIEEEHTYPTLPRYHLTSIACDTLHSVIFAGGDVLDEGGTAANAFTLRFSETLELDWHKDLVATPGFATRLGRRGALAWTGASLIAAGSTGFEKSQPPGDGGYWDAGFIASLSPEGAVQWSQAVVLSSHSEGFHSCWVDGDALYAAGYAARFSYSSDRRAFGYGLLTKLDLTTGEVLFNDTFGSPEDQSGFNSVVVHGEHAWCAGYTARDLLDRYRSWFAEVDFARPVSRLVSKSTVSCPGYPTAAVSNETVRSPRLADQWGVSP